MKNNPIRRRMNVVTPKVIESRAYRGRLCAINPHTPDKIISAKQNILAVRSKKWTYSQSQKSVGFFFKINYPDFLNCASGIVRFLFGLENIASEKCGRR